MAKAHQHGIIHRDIKPANILIAGDHQAKVVDFSLAKLTGETGLTRTGSTIGTAAFMSPEQVEGRPVNHQSDIWSLAVTLYCMISGELPFSGEVDQSVMYAIVRHEPKAVKLAAGEVPKGLDRVLDRALQRDPIHRAMVEAGLGNRGLALRWLKQADANHSPQLAFLRVLSKPRNVFAVLAQEPEYQKLIARMKLPEESGEKQVTRAR